MIYWGIAIVTLIVTLGLIVYKTFKPEDKGKKIVFFSIGLVVILLALVFMFVKSKNGSSPSSDDDSIFPWFIFFPMWISLVGSVGNKKKSLDDKDLEHEKKNRMLVTFIIIGLTVLVLGLSLYLYLSLN
ncbi:hypothetical protein RJG79_01940 [Mycoplasmatota bacterium WC44]